MFKDGIITQEEYGKALEDLRQKTEEANRSTEELLDSLFKLFNLNQSVTEATWDFEDALEEYNKILEEQAKKSSEAQRALREYNSLIWQLGQSAPEAQEKLQLLQQAEAKYHEDLVKFNSTDEKAIKLLGEHYLAIEELNKVIQEYGEDSEQANEIRKKANEIMDEYNEYVKRSIDSYTEVEKAQRAYNDAVIEYGKNTSEAKIAQEELNRILEKHLSENREVQGALFDLQDARERLIDAIWREFSAEGTTIERQRELRDMYIELGEEAVEKGEMSEEAFANMLTQFTTTTMGIETSIYENVVPAYKEMYMKGQELDKQVIEPEIKVDTSQAEKNIKNVISLIDRVKSKEVTIKAVQISQMGYAGGGLIKAQSGLNISGGNAVPVIIHPPEVILNKEQALNVLWNLANQPKVSGGVSNSIVNNFNISELIVREDADIVRIAEELKDMQDIKYRGAGIK